MRQCLSLAHVVVGRWSPHAYFVVIQEITTVNSNSKQFIIINRHYEVCYCAISLLFILYEC